MYSNDAYKIVLIKIKFTVRARSDVHINLDMLIGIVLGFTDFTKQTSSSYFLKNKILNTEQL